MTDPELEALKTNILRILEDIEARFPSAGLEERTKLIARARQLDKAVQELIDDVRNELPRSNFDVDLND